MRTAATSSSGARCFHTVYEEDDVDDGNDDNTDEQPAINDEVGNIAADMYTGSGESFSAFSKTFEYMCAALCVCVCVCARARALQIGDRRFTTSADERLAYLGVVIIVDKDRCQETLARTLHRRAESSPKPACSIGTDESIV
jgi:hypothetical protein